MDGGGGGGRGGRGGATILAVNVRLERGTHVLTLVADDVPAGVISLAVSEKSAEVSPEKRALHYRLLGVEPGDRVSAAAQSCAADAGRVSAESLPPPVTPAEVDHFLALYDRAAERGDPYEERDEAGAEGRAGLFRFPLPHGGAAA